MVRYCCDKCGARLESPEGLRGKPDRCPACRYENVVPASSGRFNRRVLAKGAIAAVSAVAMVLLLLVVYELALKPTHTESSGQPRDGTQTALPVPASGPAPIAAAPPQRSKTPLDLPPGFTLDAPPTPSGPATRAAPASPAGPMPPHELFSRASPAVVRIVMRDGDFKAVAQGSGFFVSADGLLVTNHHVIEAGEFATVLLTDNSTLFVEGVAASDPNADLALLKVNAKDLPFLPVAAGSPPKVGDKAYAIGNPKGLTNSMSEGIVSGVRKDKGLRLIQTTAAISKGSSGGPLLAADGKVIGVTTASLGDGQNLNFAVATSHVRALMENRGKLRTLASAGGKRLDHSETEQIDKAWDALRRKDYREAAKLLGALREKQPDNSSVWFALGFLHSKLGNYENAISHYKVVISLSPDSEGAYYNTACAYLNLKQYAEAVAWFKKVALLVPDDMETHLRIGRVCNFEAGKLEYEIALGESGEVDALGMLKGLARDSFRRVTSIAPKSPEEFMFVAEAYSHMKMYVNAIDVCRKAITAYPSSAKAYLYAGSTYIHQGQHEDAIEIYQEAIGKVTGKDLAEAYRALGDAFLKMKHPAKALESYEKANAADPASARYYTLAQAYREMGDFPKAIAAWKKEIERDESAGSYCELGDTCLDAGLFAGALDAYKAALELIASQEDDFYEGDAYLGMASAYRHLKRYENAVNAFLKAMDHGFTGSRVWLDLGDTFREWGKTKEAIESYKMAVTGGRPSDEPVQQARRRIAELQSGP